MPRCHYCFSVIRPPSRIFTARPYPVFPETIGDFLRKKRLDSGLLQKDVATLLKINVASIRNWESNLRLPDLQALPEIINFIGCCPYDVNLPFNKKLVIRREINGITQKKMARLIGVDPSTLARWEQGERTPSFNQRLRIAATVAIFGEIQGRNLGKDSQDKSKLKYPLFEGKDYFEHLKIDLTESEVKIIQKRLTSTNYVLYDPAWTIGKKLSAWRTNFGLSQRTMAKLTGYAHQSLCRWETGKRIPKLETVFKIKNSLVKLHTIYDDNAEFNEQIRQIHN